MIIELSAKESFYCVIAQNRQDDVGFSFRPPALYMLSMTDVDLFYRCILTNWVLWAGGASVMDLRSSTVTLSMFSKADPE